MAADDVVWSRWDEVDRLFARALDLSEDERKDFLSRTCGEDPDVYDAVLQLLENARNEDRRATSPGPDLLVAALPQDDDRSPLPGDVVGRYRVLGELGQGGMATVFEAERSDGAYEQVVALKILRRGLDTRRIIERFITERQILSDFAHPHVARLLDGGTTLDGRPFLVMEKVDGQPITDWADEGGLDLEARLGLFLQATEAVKEAHRRLVVHRDLKPSNILVDRMGRVKLLDFGIAKLLHPQPGEALTELGTYPLTRGWASPEQLRGDPVTTSSDIYQLGLLLFRLLTGLPPFEGGTRPEQRSAPPPSRVLATAGARVRAQAAAARSTSERNLRRALRGDLDTIVGKALEPKPQDRYSSVEDLAGDLRRYLEGQPIRARPAPWPLRVRKWLGRNRWAPPVAALLLAVAGGYVATLSLTADRLERERNEAQAQARRAERIKTSLIDIFRSADPWAAPDPGARADLTVVEALSDAPDRIRAELGDDPAVQADLLAALASIFTNLDRSAEGLPLIEEALALRSRTGDTSSPSFAADLQILGDAVGPEAPDSAARLLMKAVEILEASVPPGDPRIGQALHSLFWHQYSVMEGRDPSAGERALEILRAAGPDHIQDVAGVLGGLSQIYSHIGDLERAEQAAREHVQLRLDGMGEGDVRTAIAKAGLAQILDARGAFEQSIPLYHESIPVLVRSVGPEHHQTLTVMNNLAQTFHLSGRFDEAIEMHREVLAARQRRAGSEPDQDVAGSLQNLAAALKELGRLREADSLTNLAYDIYVATTPEGSYLPAFPLLTRTEILLLAGDFVRAESTARTAWEILRDALPDGHYAIGVARCRLGTALLEQGREVEGRPHVRGGLAIAQADPRTPAHYREECDRSSRRLSPPGAAPARRKPVTPPPLTPPPPARSRSRGS